MIYLASRSHPKYLAKLLEISKRSSLCSIVSITGGLAFLHALSSKASSLVLIDSDPEVTEYGKAIIEVISRCQTRSDFFGLLTGRILTDSGNDTIRFSLEPFENREAILSNLSYSTRDCVERWYRPDKFDTATSVMKVEDKVVHFFGSNLSHQHFNWHCGWGCFSSEKSYKDLNQNLTRLKPKFITMPLEEYDFRSSPANTLVLASNTDSPLFTKNDAILHRIKHSANNECYYVSRTRDYSVADSNQIIRFEHSKLTLAPIGVGIPEDLRTKIATIFPHNWNYITVEQYLNEHLYDQECVLFLISANEIKNTTSLKKKLYDELPIHQRIAFMSNKSVEAVANTPHIIDCYRESERFEIEKTALGKIEGVLFELKHRTPYLSE